MQQLKRHLGKRFRPFVHLVFPQMPAEELIRYLADELTTEIATTGQSSASSTKTKNNPPAPKAIDTSYESIAGSCSIETSVRRIQNFLAQNAAADQHAVVAIDEAHLLDESRTWEALRLLLNFETDSRPGFHLAARRPAGPCSRKSIACPRWKNASA